MFTDNNNGPNGFFNPNQSNQSNQQNNIAPGGAQQQNFQGNNQYNNQQQNYGQQQNQGYQNSNQQGYGQKQQQQRPVYQGDKQKKVFTPVTVRMVMNSQPRPDDICEFDGDPVNDIILTGRLLRRVEEPMRTQFEINDNTGTFHVLFYHKGENQVPVALKNFQYDQFCYAKVYGNIRVFKEEKAIVGTHIKRIEKFDELTNHFLSCYVSHCIRKKGVLKPRELALDQSALETSGAVGEGGPPGAGMSIDNVGGQALSSHELAGRRMSGGMSSGMQNIPSSNQNQPLDLRKTILQVMKEMQKTQKFLSKQNVFSVVQDRTDRNTFEKELNNLQENGEICQAFDANHFCLVE